MNANNTNNNEKLLILLGEIDKTKEKIKGFIKNNKDKKENKNLIKIINFIINHYLKWFNNYTSGTNEQNLYLIKSLLGINNKYFINYETENYNIELENAERLFGLKKDELLYIGSINNDIYNKKYYIYEFEYNLMIYFYSLLKKNLLNDNIIINENEKENIKNNFNNYLLNNYIFNNNELNIIKKTNNYKKLKEEEQNIIINYWFNSKNYYFYDFIDDLENIKETKKLLNIKINNKENNKILIKYCFYGCKYIYYSEYKYYLNSNRIKKTDLKTLLNIFKEELNIIKEKYKYNNKSLTKEYNKIIKTFENISKYKEQLTFFKNYFNGSKINQVKDIKETIEKMFNVELNDIRGINKELIRNLLDYLEFYKKKATPNKKFSLKKVIKIQDLRILINDILKIIFKIMLDIIETYKIFFINLNNWDLLEYKFYFSQYMTVYYLVDFFRNKTTLNDNNIILNDFDYDNINFNDFYNILNYFFNIGKNIDNQLIIIENIKDNEFLKDYKGLFDLKEIGFYNQILDEL